MDYSDAVLTITGQADSGIMGRTAIQKLIYFASQKMIVKKHFIPHYYGPYSEEVSRAIMSLTSLNFVREELESASAWPYNFRRYTYSLTKEGAELLESIKDEFPSECQEVKLVFETSERVTGLSIPILSCAAKTHYILKKRGEPMTSKQIQKEAQNFGWHPTKEQMAKASELLQRLELVEITE